MTNKQATIREKIENAIESAVSVDCTMDVSDCSESCSECAKQRVFSLISQAIEKVREENPIVGWEVSGKLAFNEALNAVKKELGV